MSKKPPQRPNRAANKPAPSKNAPKSGPRRSDSPKPVRNAGKPHAGTAAKPKARGKAAHAGRPANAHTRRTANVRPGGAVSAEDITVGERIIVTIKRIGINGEGVGYYRKKAVFIQGALPGEVVKADVTKINPTHLYAQLVQIEQHSPDRIRPACPVYQECGGCQLQHLSYPGQLKAKEELVREAFQRYTGSDDINIRPILGMDDPWGYRGKAQLQTGENNGRILTGLYSPGSRRLVDISGCPIQYKEINQIVQKVKDILLEADVPVYDDKARAGALRTLVVRSSRQTGEAQVTFVTKTNTFPKMRQVLNAIRRDLPQVVTVAQNINPAATPLVFGGKTKLLWGKERMDERLGPLQFSLSPRAFFQLNPEQTVQLYDAVKQAAGLTGHELLVDAYCGTGTIALWLAPFAREVRGIESVREAVDDARRNAAQNGFEHVRFYEGEAEKLLREWVAQGVRPDVIVVDPPRTGCDRSLLEAVAKARPKRFVYVSCNPSTLAKDCSYLLDQGFRIDSVQPVDMFPQTSHVECVVGIQRVESTK